MNFIKNIFFDKIDASVHRQFIRYGKGTFNDRAIVEITVGSRLKIKTSFEYANDFVRFLAGKINGKINVTGGIITAKDIRNDAKFKINDIKQFAGVKTYLIDTKIDKEDLLDIMNKFSDAVYCLSFSTDYGSLKVKVKSPKSAKPGKDDEEAKADYCTFTTNDLNFKNEFAFDVKDKFSKFRANHTLIINEIIVPEEYKNDFARARTEGKRKGKLIREIDIDGVKKKSEKEFLA